MDYIEIMLRGYTNENDQNFLGKYFIREFKKAEKEHYDLEEFFTGLLKGIDTLKNEYQIKLFKRKNELYLMLEAAENGTGKYANNENLTIEDNHKKTIEYCKNELSSIGLGYSTINLLHFTNSRFIGHLQYSEVEFIGNGIAKAYSVLSEPKQPEDVKPDEVLKNEFDKVFKNDIGFTIFTKMFELYKTENTHLANFSFLFYAMEKDFLVCSQTDFVKFLENDKYDVSIEKIDSRQSGKNRKSKLYNSIKESLQKKHEKSTI
jgi:hypothetical protein